MKSETVESDRAKHRRKISKNLTAIVNGADVNNPNSNTEDTECMRQINHNAAFHDHISCTKSAELSKIDGSSSRSPCETDHIHATFSNDGVENIMNITDSLKLAQENKQLRKVLVIQLELIKQLEHENSLLKKRRHFEWFQSYSFNQKMLKHHCKSEDESYLLLSHKEPNTSFERKNTSFTGIISTNSEGESVFTTPSIITSATAEHSSGTVPIVNLATRYFGRRSKTVPSRALKRRYMGPPKILPFKKPILMSVTTSSATSLSSESEIHEDEVNFHHKSFPHCLEITKEFKGGKLLNSHSKLIDIKKLSRKRNGKRLPKISCKMIDFVTTDKEYFLPNTYTVSQSSLISSDIDVPSWKLNPVTSFYKMEGTENINDSIFQRRHLKCEQDERRRKRWDIQRLREQKVAEKLKYKYYRDNNGTTIGQQENNSLPQLRSQLSFFPDPRHIQFIEVTDQLPVLAFGHLIPLFQPSEFSISWKCKNSPAMEFSFTEDLVKKN